MNTQKKHFYITHASFKDANQVNGIEQQYNSTIDTDTNKITKSSLEEIRLHMVKDIETKWPNIRVKELRLNSLSYLGEMTHEEFNS